MECHFVCGGNCCCRFLIIGHIEDFALVEQDEHLPKMSILQLKCKQKRISFKSLLTKLAILWKHKVLGVGSPREDPACIWLTSGVHPQWGDVHLGLRKVSPWTLSSLRSPGFLKGSERMNILLAIKPHMLINFFFFFFLQWQHLAKAFLFPSLLHRAGYFFFYCATPVPKQDASFQLGTTLMPHFVENKPKFSN